MHGERSGQIGADGVMARRWASVGVKGRPSTKRLLQGRGAVVPGDDVADAPGVALEPFLAQDQGHLQAEQLVEGQPAAGRFDLGDPGGPVDVVEGGGAVDQIEPEPPPVGHRVGEAPRHGRVPHPRSGRAGPR